MLKVIKPPVPTKNESTLTPLYTKENPIGTALLKLSSAPAPLLHEEILFPAIGV
ncbi:MAG: hypothetical protein R2942_14665 [Ignavibacteria bacterium]